MAAPPELPSFWSSSATPSLVHVLCSKLFGPRQEVLQNPPQRLAPPPTVRSLTPADIPQVSVVLTDQERETFAQFLTTNFADSQHPRPSLTARQMKQLGVRGVRYLMYRVPAIVGTIQGVISSQLLGRLRRGGSAPTDYEVRLISNFCVAPAHRQRGVGNALLQAVLADSRELGQTCAIFLKEGAPIGRAGPSLYSSSWMYRRYKGRDFSYGVHEVIPKELLEVLAIYIQQNPRIIHNIPRDSNSLQTRVFVFRGFSGSVMAAFTPAHQRHPKNGAEIIYQTGWIERGDVMPTERIEAARSLSEYAARAMGAGWIWMDRAVFAGKALPAPWKADGPFHWYAYNWSAGYYGTTQLFLLV
jgi:ribosomal protein S18 acetylase RimI-like enzyme